MKNALAKKSYSRKIQGEKSSGISAKAAGVLAQHIPLYGGRITAEQIVVKDVAVNSNCSIVIDSGVICYGVEVETNFALSNLKKVRVKFENGVQTELSGEQLEECNARDYSGSSEGGNRFTIPFEELALFNPSAGEFTAYHLLNENGSLPELRIEFELGAAVNPSIKITPEIGYFPRDNAGNLVGMLGNNQAVIKSKVIDINVGVADELYDISDKINKNLFRYIKRIIFLDPVTEVEIKQNGAVRFHRDLATNKRFIERGAKAYVNDNFTIDANERGLSDVIDSQGTFIMKVKATNAGNVKAIIQYADNPLNS